MANIEALYETCEYLEKDLQKMNEKIRSANGVINNDTLNYIDKLTHAIKSVKTTIATTESEGYSERDYSRDGMSYNDGMSYGGMSYGDRYDGGSSYARGRGSNAKRDSMGRYSSEHGYSRNDGYSHGGADDDTMRRINDLMSRTTEPQFKNELQQIMRNLEQRQM